MYTLEAKTEEIKTDEGSAFKIIGLRILCAGRLCCELNGGLCLTVQATHANLQSQWEARAQDFLHGIVLALSHCAITGSVPVAMVG